MYTNLTPEMLVKETHNYYGLKADLHHAIEYLSNQVHATPGNFYDWLRHKQHRASQIAD